MASQRVSAAGPASGVYRAGELIRAAIIELDQAGAPSDIAAHLDLALHRIETCQLTDPSASD
jgi:hypothetical protein